MSDYPPEIQYTDLTPECERRPFGGWMTVGDVREVLAGLPAEMPVVSGYYGVIGISTHRESFLRTGRLVCDIENSE